MTVPMGTLCPCVLVCWHPQSFWVLLSEPEDRNLLWIQPVKPELLEEVLNILIPRLHPWEYLSNSVAAQSPHVGLCKTQVPSQMCCAGPWMVYV